MDAFLTTYLPADATDFILQWFQLFPIGIALGVIAWLFTFVWSAIVHFFHM